MLFKEQYCKQLSWAERLEFLNMWYVLIIINDFMMVVGSVFKIEIENKVRSQINQQGLTGWLPSTSLAWCRGWYVVGTRTRKPRRRYYEAS